MGRYMMRTLMLENGERQMIMSTTKECGDCNYLRTFIFPWKVDFLENKEFVYHYCLTFSNRGRCPLNDVEFGLVPEPLKYGEEGKPLRHKYCIAKEIPSAYDKEDS